MAQGTLRSRWELVNGLPVHARVSSTPMDPRGPAVVLVHGLVVSSRYMVPTAEMLAPRYPVYLVDLPGFGESGKPRHVLNVMELADALAEWIRILKLEQPVVVANSFGCQVVVELGARHPHALSRAVLVGPTVDPRARNPFSQIWRWLLDVFRESPRLWLVMIRDAMAAGPRRGLGTFRNGLSHQMDKRLPHLRVPTLVVRGTRDTLVPEEWGRRAASLLPKGRYVAIPGAPHAINYSAPQELVREIVSFIDEAPAYETRRQTA